MHATVLLNPHVPCVSGMIMWPKAKRAVSDQTASQIAELAVQHQARAVGVFVDEDAATIVDRWVCMMLVGDSLLGWLVVHHLLYSQCLSLPKPAKCGAVYSVTEILHWWHDCRCRKAGIGVAQLHGEGARSALPDLQGTGLEVVYVMHATPDGKVQTPLPQMPVDWVLIDGLQVGWQATYATSCTWQ